MIFNTNTIFQRLQNIEAEISKLNNILFSLKTTDIQKYRTNYESLSTVAALRAERIACQLWNLVFITDQSDKNDYLKFVADTQGITISSEN